MRSRSFLLSDSLTNHNLPAEQSDQRRCRRRRLAAKIQNGVTLTWRHQTRWRPQAKAGGNAGTHPSFRPLLDPFLQICEVLTPERWDAKAKVISEFFALEQELIPARSHAIDLYFTPEPRGVELTEGENNLIWEYADGRWRQKKSQFMAYKSWNMKTRPKQIEDSVFIYYFKHEVDILMSLFTCTSPFNFIF